MEMPELLQQARQVTRLAPVIPLPVDLTAVRKRTIEYEQQGLPLVITNQLAKGSILLGNRMGQPPVMSATIEHAGPPPYQPSTVQIKVRATSDRTKPDGSPQPGIGKIVDALNLDDQNDLAIIELASALNSFSPLPWKLDGPLTQIGHFSSKLQAAQDLTAAMCSSTEQADYSAITYEPVLAWGQTPAIGRYVLALHTVVTEIPAAGGQTNRSTQTLLSVETSNSRTEARVADSGQITWAKRLDRPKPFYPQLDDRYKPRTIKTPDLANPIGQFGHQWQEAPVFIGALIGHLDNNSPTTDRAAFFASRPK